MQVGCSNSLPCVHSWVMIGVHDVSGVEAMVSSFCGAGWEGCDVSFSFLVFLLVQVQQNITVNAKG